MLNKKLLVTLILLSPLLCSAQFYRIYQYQTAEAGEKEAVYWFSAINSDHRYSFFGDEVDRNGLTAHSLEMEYGLSNKWTVGFYLDFEQPEGQNLRHVRSKALMAHGRFWEKGERPIDLGFYAEYKLPRKGYSDSEELEFIIIMEKDYGFHTFVLNPVFEKKISGPDVVEGVECAINGGYYYKKSPSIQPGIEIFSKIGELKDPHDFKTTKTYLFPSVYVTLGKKGRIIWHTGLGFGLTDPADNMVFKSILSVGFF